MITIEPTLTLDGVATLTAGVIAFVAIMLQIRSSRRAVEKQLNADRQARVEEQERQKLAVAKAVLFEIDAFYRYHLRDPRVFLANTDVLKADLPGVKSVAPHPFPVYYGNTGFVGRLDDEGVQAIVEFLAAAQSHLATARDYKSSMERFLRGDNPATAEVEARTYLSQMKNALPEMIKLAYIVCFKLCKLTGVPFEHPKIAVAGEPLTMEKIAASLQRTT
ncbi:MAG: hypothetical protein ACE5HL_03150 [Terriglobia bacterium]